jgi:hypothetical protein
MLKIKPKKIGVEVSSICQLRCRSCPNAGGAIRSVIGSGFLRIKDFRRLVDENPWVTEMWDVRAISGLDSEATRSRAAFCSV